MRTARMRGRATGSVLALLMLTACSEQARSDERMASPSSAIDFGQAPGSPFKIAGGGHSFAIGDVNRDDAPDLVVVGNDGFLHVLLGDGRGQLRRAPTAPAKLARRAGELVLADFNHDGTLDWAGAHHDSYDVVVMLGKDGAFVPSEGSPFRAREGSRPHTHALAAGDVNGDGHLDLVSANNGDDDVSVLLGDGRGRFGRAPHSPFPIGPSPYPLALADVNGDGALDIVAPNSHPDLRRITVLLGDGRGSFRPAGRPPLEASGPAYYVAVADVSSDGKPDIIATHNGDTLITVLLGDGRGDFTSATGSPLDLGSRAWWIVAADVDRDGKVDLAAAAEHGVALLLGDGRGSFTRAERSPFRAGRGTWRLGLADFNGDEKLDIVTANVESDDITLLLGR